ncbi:MAG: efflux RND transporter permease subunit [Gammaproteobacteria bacterium]|nr:efflux RND transporter permease subunit [Gammaproteobacteria bacterium]
MSKPTGPLISTRTGGIAAWSIRHPVGVSMIALALVVIGLFFSLRLPVDLLPNIVYPEVRVRILDSGVSARIMEDQVTRNLEEQLAITENVISLVSTSKEGESQVDLSFPYGTDIDIALRDASNRLDRAQRSLPTTIEAPIIFKSDPQQIPVAEFVVSSTQLDPVQLRSFVDYTLSKWFLNLPGVAATEVGGGLVREIQVLPDLERLAAIGLTPDDLVQRLRDANRDVAAGKLRAGPREYISRTVGRLRSLDELRKLPIQIADGRSLPLAELATINDTHEDERLRVRFDGIGGVKLTIQKQPTANTVAVVDAVMTRLNWLHDNKLLPDDIEIHTVSDQSIYVRYALNNALLAGLSGAALAMAVVFLFLGDLRSTLVIGSAIPIAIAVTLSVMELTGLTLNIMSLGGLAVGIGMLVDSSIVMLENIHRHQQQGEDALTAGVHAATEVNSAIVASTSTNLAAVLPFLMIVGLTGLLFRELIITVSAAIFAAMLVALTLVPAWGTRLWTRRSDETRWRRTFDHQLEKLQRGYARLLNWLISHRTIQVPAVLLFTTLLVWSTMNFLSGKEIFLPSLDDGNITVRVTGDTGTAMDTMDAVAKQLENLFHAQAEVASVFTTTGGFIFGRTERELTSRATLQLQLKPLDQRSVSSDDWIMRMDKEIAALQLVGYNVTLRVAGLRGLRIGGSEDDISFRIQGPDLDILNTLGPKALAALEGIPGLRNLSWSGEESQHELAINLDRERVSQLGLNANDIGTALRFALNGEVAGDFIDGDRQFDIRVRLPQPTLKTLADLESTLLFASDKARPAVRLSDVARISLTSAPTEIERYQQQRMVEINGSLSGDAALSDVMQMAQQRLDTVEMPQGYRAYDVGSFQALQEGRQTAGILLALALFLVFVVMAVQYESLRNPLVILLGVPFAIIGPALFLPLQDVPLSMPVWLGLIMLAGIVVNNAIVLVEYIEILREQGLGVHKAIIRAGELRLRPILMTTLTTVFGLLPLSLGLGEGAEMLQPLAQTMIYGLSFSLLISLLLIPIIYIWFQPDTATAAVAD